METTVQAREEQGFDAKSDAPTYVVQLQNANWQTKQKSKFTARVLSSNVPLTDLKEHLRGAAYGVAISEDGQQFVRLEAEKREKGAIETTFYGMFPAKGLHKIWLEFRHADKIIVAPFTINVRQNTKQQQIGNQEKK